MNFSMLPEKLSYGLIQSALGNSDLGWETTETWNTGFESSWLKNRIFVDLDLYSSKDYRPDFHSKYSRYDRF